MKTRTLTPLLVLFIALFFNNIISAQDDPETPYDDQQVKIVKKGSKAWEGYLKAYKDKNGKLPVINFEEAELAGVDFRAMNLDNANFTSADLRGARFGDMPAKKNAVKDNEGQVIKAVVVPPASLKGAIFTGADVGEHELKVADFSLANCEGTDFSSCDLTGTRFVKTILKGSSFKGASLEGTNFRKADMTDADLSEADVEGTIFDRTILIRTHMAGLNVNECIMTDVILNEKQLAEYLEKEKNSDQVYED